MLVCYEPHFCCSVSARRFLGKVVGCGSVSFFEGIESACVGVLIILWIFVWCVAFWACFLAVCVVGCGIDY